MVYFGLVDPNDMTAPGQRAPLNFCSGIVHVLFVDRPKIRMPRALRARFIKQVGEQINLVIPFLVSQSLCISKTEYSIFRISCLTLSK